MDAQQELFTALRQAIELQGYDVYDGMLPPEGTSYPFVYLGDASQIDTETKTAPIGEITQTIHVWHNTPKKRGTVSEMMIAIKKICRIIDKTTSHAWTVNSINSRIITDNTTKTPLHHVML